MSTEMLNNTKKTNRNTYVDINELKRKAFNKEKKEKLQKNIILASVCVGITAIGYLII